MKSLQLIAGLGLVLCGAASCQKVIEIKPNAFTQRYVIEGELTDAPGPHSVKVTRTRSVTDDNSFDAVNDALVIITDQTNGVVDTLQLSTGGEYHTTRVTGIAGHTYQLSVRIGSELFTGASTIPAAAVNIDTMYVSKSQFGDDYFVIPEFTDPAGRGNYYRLKQWLNGRLIKGAWLRDDNARDGQTYKSALRYQTGADNSDPKISNGDSVRVELQSIGKESYDYYRTLDDVTGYSFTTPANPLTNLSGGALGVFATGLSRTKGIVARF